MLLYEYENKWYATFDGIDIRDFVIIKDKYYHTLFEGYFSKMSELKEKSIVLTKGVSYYLTKISIDDEFTLLLEVEET